MIRILLYPPLRLELGVNAMFGGNAREDIIGKLLYIAK